MQKAGLQASTNPNYMCVSFTVSTNLMPDVDLNRLISNKIICDILKPDVGMLQYALLY